MLDATAIILSGGKNSRMGRNKAFLQVGKQRIIDSLVSKTKAIFDQVLVVSNTSDEYDYLGIEVVSDLIPGFGPLSGMHAGLKSAKYHHSLVIACDMPFVETGLAQMLIKEAPGFDVVVPQVGEYLQPLFAVYAKSCIEPIEECLNNSISKVYTFYPGVKVKYVQQDKMARVADLTRVFINVNTPEELETARGMENRRQNG